MGGTSSTRRVTFEADENENITVVKGIRVSEGAAGSSARARVSGLSPKTSLRKRGRGYPDGAGDLKSLSWKIL